MKRFLSVFFSALAMTAWSIAQVPPLSSAAADVPAVLPVSAEDPDVSAANDLFRYHVADGHIIIDGHTEKCESITELVIPSEIEGLPVTEIGKEAFCLCGFTSVVIPDSIVKIGLGAFAICGNLINVEMPEKCPEIEGAPFIYTPYMQEKLNNTDVWIEDGILISVSTEEESFIIPAGVHKIAGLAFFACDNLKELTIPDGVSLSSSSFEKLDTLEKVTLPDTMTEIPAHAFYKCFALTSVEFPDNLKKIGEAAFGCCYALSSITFPDGLTDVAPDAFDSCKKLVIQAEHGSFAEQYAHNHCIMCSYPEGITEPFRFHKSSRGHVVIDSWTDHLEEREHLVIPAEIYGVPVGEIGESAFADGGEEIVSVTLPASVKSIGALAFDGCTNLRSIDLTNVSDFIGAQAFRGCRSLEEITLPDKLINHEEKVFEGCTALKTICFGNACKYIPNLHWYGLPTDIITTVKIPDSVRIIDSNAFISCKSLTSLTVPSGVDTIRGTAFGDWTLLYVESGSYAEQYAKENGCLFDVIGENNPHIEATDLAFFVYHAEDGHIVIDDSAEKCKALKVIVIPEYIDGLPVTKIGCGAFFLCECRKVILPSHIEIIDEAAFGCCFALEEINLPAGLTEIGREAFREDSEIKEIRLPDSLKRIGWGAFILCRKLDRIEMPDSIEFIGKDAFYLDPATIGHQPVLLVKAGSYAESYAKDNYVKYELKDPPATTTAVTTETTQTTTTTETTGSTETAAATTVLTESTGTTANLPQTGTASSGGRLVVYLALLMLCAGVWLMAYSLRETE